MSRAGHRAATVPPLAVLCGLRQRGAATGRSRRGRPRHVQSLLPTNIDIKTMKPWPEVELSTSTDLLLRLRWLAILHGHVRPSLAVTGGRRHTPRWHQGPPGRGRRGADGVGDLAPCAGLLFGDASWAGAVDGVAHDGPAR